MTPVETTFAPEQDVTVVETMHHRPTRVDSPPESPTESVAGSPRTPANRDVQRSLQTPRGHRRHHVAGSLCLREASDALSRDHKEPSAPYRDRHGDQSATLYEWVVGGRCHARKRPHHISPD